MFLIGPAHHLPKFKLDLVIVSRHCWFGEGHQPHLNHSIPELSCIIEFMSDVFSDPLSHGLHEGVLSRHYIVDRVLDLSTLAFKLGFMVGALSVPVVALLIRTGSKASALTSVHGRGAPTSWVAQHLILMEKNCFLVCKC